MAILKQSNIRRSLTPQEAESIVSYIEGIQVTSTEKPLSIAVLSPYRRQVDLLKDRILNAKMDGRINFRERFSGNDSAAKISMHIGTVDSFQGDESDLVIISMVRNNHHTGLSGIGFMRRPNRMNVLTSRAIWQLVLVGSHEFWSTRVAATTSDEERGAFLKRMFDFINKELTSDGCVKIINADTIRV